MDITMANSAKKGFYEGKSNFPSTISKKAGQVLSSPAGMFKAIRYAFEMIYYYLKPRKTFFFRGRKYKCFYHWYNTTWRGEREIEIPIIRGFLRNSRGRVLEIGDVMRHYSRSRHPVLDKYENAPNIIHEDVTAFKPARTYDLIISISTLEHVGFDESKKDSKKFTEAVSNIKRMLSKGGTFVFTVPMGYNPHMDAVLLGKKIELTEGYFIKKEGNRWVQRNLSPGERPEYSNTSPRVLFVGIFHNK